MKFGRIIQSAQFEGYTLNLSLKDRQFWVYLDGDNFDQIIGSTCGVDNCSPNGEIFRAAFTHFRNELKQRRDRARTNQANFESDFRGLL